MLSNKKWEVPVLLLPMAVNRDEWPLMVRLALSWFFEREIAVGFVWVTVGLALVGMVFGIGSADWRAFVPSGLLPIVALWYWLSVRWVDQNSDWE